MFDFSRDPLRLYGIFPQTPFPIEVSIYSLCSLSCGYCFSNLNRLAADREPNMENPTPKLMNKIARVLDDEQSPFGFFLRERYPVCMSNSTDPFQRYEKTYRSTETFMKWARADNIPLYIQTKGNVLHEEFDRYKDLIVPGKDVVYISLTHQDDAVRKKIEPGALCMEKRWELAAMLSERGIPVVAACNPYLKEWVPDHEKYLDDCVKAGVRGVWMEHLHFNKSQAEALPDFYRPLLAKGNLPPMYYIGILKKWYAATAARGLDYFPTPRWDAYFGCPARHPECADPAWMGGKTFDFPFRFVQRLARFADANPKKLILFSWNEIAGFMEELGVPNPVLKTAPFDGPFYSGGGMKADRWAWRSHLGEHAPLYEILRHYWNHPGECQNFLWYHPFVQALFDTTQNLYVTDADGDHVGVYNPTIKHHGKKVIDEEIVAKWTDGVVWFKSFSVQSSGDEPGRPETAAQVSQTDEIVKTP